MYDGVPFTQSTLGNIYFLCNCCFIPYDHGYFKQSVSGILASPNLESSSFFQKTTLRTLSVPT